jgi:hypothetical protein
MKIWLSACLVIPQMLMVACDLIPTEVDIPIPLNTPPVDIDVGAAMDDGVDSACETPENASCQSIGLICQAEEGAPCDPVVLPAQFPNEIDVEGTPTPAVDLLPEELIEASRIKLALPVDLAGALEEEGVANPDQVKAISFSEVFVTWDENTLTFDAPVLDVYVGPVVDGLDALDPEELITQSGFEKIGTVGIDTDGEGGFDVGQLAGTTGQVPLSFVDGGNDTFNEALKSFAFTLVLVAPEGQTLTLKAVDGDATKVSAPDGAASIKLEATLNYTVDLADAAGIGDAE